eukprot:365343-Chlamydomonas_euryale.AAC.6
MLAALPRPKTWLSALVPSLAREGARGCARQLWVSRASAPAAAAQRGAASFIPNPLCMLTMLLRLRLLLLLRLLCRRRHRGPRRRHAAAPHGATSAPRTTPRSERIDAARGRPRHAASAGARMGLCLRGSLSGLAVCTARKCGETNVQTKQKHACCRSYVRTISDGETLLRAASALDAVTTDRSCTVKLQWSKVRTIFSSSTMPCPGHLTPPWVAT